ncbi:hypothetical protein LCGC14_1365170 [marine sediment metagenome]|uniref:Uncharacterized protein n=1 Tax=marine sediment metagenome TaxID=412755 RepID=A0A0F9MM44_9ZZZZ
MFIANIPYWKPVEESRDSTTFEGSLQSKMSKLNFDQDFWDMLKCKRNSNNIRRFSAILYGEVQEDLSVSSDEQVLNFNKLLLLSEKWSGFTDVNGEQKSVNDLTSREMLIIMHHKVILEYIQQNVLRNNRDLDVIKKRIDKYYNNIIEYLGGLNFGLNMKNHIKNYILDKLESYINEKSKNKMEGEFLKDYLTIFPKNTDIDHTGETWIVYISNVLFPSFENEYLR